MSTLVLRYAAPLMSFGHSARFDRRATATTPTVSAIQGMVAAAAGIGRAQTWPNWIASIHLAFRIERRGRMLSDYHTVNEPPARRYRHLSDRDRKRVRVLANADGGRASFENFVTHRSYVADASFLVTIEDPDRRIHEALDDPKWALYAGRKSCPLTDPFVLGRHDGTAEEALAAVPTVDRTDGVRTAQREAIVFLRPPSDAAVEERNDRATGFRRYRPQQRWHTTVSAPVVDNWFAVIGHLAGSSP